MNVHTDMLLNELFLNRLLSRVKSAMSGEKLRRSLAQSRLLRRTFGVRKPTSLDWQPQWIRPGLTWRVQSRVFNGHGRNGHTQITISIVFGHSSPNSS